LVSRLLNNADPQPVSSGWSEIEALYHLAYESGGNNTEPRLSNGDLSRRDRATLIGSLFSRARGGADWESTATRRALGHYMARGEASPEMDETAGLAWSADGRVL
jgi:hypothetical protein